MTQYNSICILNYVIIDDDDEDYLFKAVCNLDGGRFIFILI